MSDVRIFYSKQQQGTEPNQVYVVTPDRAAKTAATTLASSVMSIGASRPFGLLRTSFVDNKYCGILPAEASDRALYVDE